MRDTYGFTPPEPRVERFDPEWQELTEPPQQSENAQPTTEEDATPPVQEAEEPQPETEAPDFTDTTKWLECRQPEVVPYTEPNGEQGQVIVRHVLTGRHFTSYRLRVEGEEGLAFVMLPAVWPKLPEPKTMEKHRWFDPYERAARPASPREIAAKRAQYGRGGQGNGSRAPHGRFTTPD